MAGCVSAGVPSVSKYALAAARHGEGHGVGDARGCCWAAAARGCRGPHKCTPGAHKRYTYSRGCGTQGVDF